MSGHRRFGSIITRTSRHGDCTRRYLEARYQPPVWAYAKWPGLPRRFTKNFDVDYRAQAEAWLAEQEKQIRLGTWEPPRVAANKGLASTVTFREYALDYVNNRRKPDGERIAETTREKYLQYLDDYLLPVLGGKRMAEITQRDIEHWADTMKVGNAGERAPIKSKTLDLLRAIFKDACERPLDSAGTTLLTVNPVRLRMPRRTSDIGYGDITPEELTTLYHAMTPRLAVLIYLIGILGMRPGEAYALQRRDVELSDDLASGTIHITKAAKPVRVPDPDTGETHRRIVVGSTKTIGSMRDLSLPKPLCVALDRHMRQFVPDKPDAYLFTGSRTLTIVSDQTVRNAWYRARKSVPRLDARKVRLYDLRHRSVSYNATYTSSAKTLMHIAGHTRLETDRHYQHELHSEMQKVLDGMTRDMEEGENAGQTKTDTPGRRPRPAPGGQAPDDTGLARLAALLGRTPVDARIQVIRRMDAKDRDALLTLLSPDTREETLTRLFSAFDVADGREPISDTGT